MQNTHSEIYVRVRNRIRTLRTPARILVALISVYVAVTSPVAFANEHILASSPQIQVVPTIEPPVVVSRNVIAPRRFVRTKRGVFSGRKLEYAIIAEDMVMKDAADEPVGSMFSFSYLAKSRFAATKDRPVMFIFNGGPGSSSTWLHMGVLGPKKIAFTDVTPRQVPPFDVVDNPDSPLAVTDLVFIDPVGTGFSRYYGKGGPKDFYGTEEDAAMFVQFINRWLRQHGRWNSPKFILGESYGTTRASLLARRLMGGYLDRTLKGISLNGVILVGGEGGLADPKGNDWLRTAFSTMAATAYYHKRVNWGDDSLQQFAQKAQIFVDEELVPALDRGNIQRDDRQLLARRIAGFTGLPVDFIIKHDLMVNSSQFATQLLADKQLSIGTYDTRYTLPTAGSLGDPVADDAAMGQYSAAFAGGVNLYVREELGVDIDDDYVVIDFANVNAAWKYSGKDAGADLAAAMRRNPDMKLMSAQGWFDLFGAVGSARYGIAQRKLDPARVSEHAYISGHMCYVGEAGVHLARDLQNFIIGASR